MFNTITLENIKTKEYIENARMSFKKDQVVVFKNILSDEGKAMLFDEMRILKSHLVKRKIESEPTTGTPRIMSTLGGKKVREFTSTIPLLYSDPETLSWLALIADDTVFTVPDKNEDMVVNSLLEKGDLHGGHVDTYSYAFNFVYEFPEEGCGGSLMLVKNSTDASDLATDQADYYDFEPGDAYLLRTDLNVHGVSSITKRSSRTILNFAYASEANRNKLSYSSRTLYS